MLFSLLAGATLLAGNGLDQVSGGVTPPEVLRHRFEVVCNGKAGSVVIEERFNRSVPSSQVRFMSIAPLGNARERPPTEAIAAAAAGMSRIQQATWSCNGRQALLLVRYFKKRGNQDERSPSGQENSPELKVFILDSRGLRPES